MKSMGRMRSHEEAHRVRIAKYSVIHQEIAEIGAASYTRSKALAEHSIGKQIDLDRGG